MVQQIVGHSKGEDTTEDYNEGFSSSVLLREAVSKLDYHNRIDLNHLAGSRYIVK